MISPTSDRVLIKRDAATDKTTGGIYIPDDAKARPVRGVVVAVGPGTKDEPMRLMAGDKVLFTKYAGNEIEVDGEELLIMRAEDVIAVIV